MQAEPVRGFRGFFRSPIGRVTFILLAIGVTFAAFAYTDTLLAIPAMLLIGLAFPVWVGLKRPRFLALAALIVLIVIAPLSTIVFTQDLLVPPASASSAPIRPWGSGGAVLDNATVAPFLGSTSTNFTWNVTLHPKYLDAQFNGTNWSNDTVDLFISSCPGATNRNSTNCAAGYTFRLLQYQFTASASDGEVVTFHDTIGATGIWSWQISLVIQNTTNASNPAYIGLVGDPTYNGLEGPIIGGFGTVYGAIIGTIYLDAVIYLGVPFYFVLILYMWYKRREARRRQAMRQAARAMAGASAGAAPGTPPPGPGTPPAAAPSGPPGPGAGTTGSARAPGELACPSCGAVVYAGESKCWKCGSALGGPPPAPPLPSKGP